MTLSEGKATGRAQAGKSDPPAASLQRGSPHFPSLPAESGSGGRRGEIPGFGHSYPAALLPVPHQLFLHPGAADLVPAGWAVPREGTRWDWDLSFAAPGF